MSWRLISYLHRGLAFLFRRKGRIAQADHHDDMAGIYRRLAREA